MKFTNCYSFTVYTYTALLLLFTFLAASHFRCKRWTVWIWIWIWIWTAECPYSQITHVTVIHSKSAQYWLYRSRIKMLFDIRQKALSWSADMLCTVSYSGVSSPGPGAMPPPLAVWQFFASILILLLSRLHTIGRGNTKVAVGRRFLLSNRLVFAAFCCLCAVHCMQAAAASYVSPKAVFLACTIGSWTAKNSGQNALEVDIFRSKVKKIFWGGGTALPQTPPQWVGGNPCLLYTSDAADE